MTHPEYTSDALIKAVDGQLLFISEEDKNSLAFAPSRYDPGIYILTFVRIANKDTFYIFNMYRIETNTQKGICFDIKQLDSLRNGNGFFSDYKHWKLIK